MASPDYRRDEAQGTAVYKDFVLLQQAPDISGVDWIEKSERNLSRKTYTARRISYNKSNSPIIVE